MKNDYNLKGISSYPLPQLFITKNQRIQAEVSAIIEIIADRRSIPALICLLDDNQTEVRWIAVQGLIKIGRRSIIPLLKSIKDGKSSCQPDKGAYHVLQSLLSSTEKRALQRLMVFRNNEAGSSDNRFKSIMRCRN